jgi:hypothetical protein
MPILQLLAFVPYKNDKLEGEMLKDVAHADVAKEDIDNTDAAYDDEYYDVRLLRNFNY